MSKQHILTIRTDKPEAEVGVYDLNGQQMAYKQWHAHKELSATIFTKIEAVLAESNVSQESVSGVIIFKGPGSFTGLRIGATIANTMSYALDIPVVGSSGDDWIKAGLERLDHGENDKIVIPEYGGEANITKPRK